MCWSWSRAAPASRSTLEHEPFGGASIDVHGVPATDALLKRATEVDAVLLGAVGGPKWDAVAADKRPEKGLLALRSAMGVYANLRPAKIFACLADASPLRKDLAEQVDYVVVRELIGGLYFGKPRSITRRARHAGGHQHAHLHRGTRSGASAGAPSRSPSSATRRCAASTRPTCSRPWCCGAG